MSVTTISIKQEDKLYFREKGINLSKFVRQARKAHENGVFEYNYVADD